MDFEEATKQAEALINGGLPTLTRELGNVQYNRVDTSKLDTANARLESSRDVTNLNIGVAQDLFTESTVAEKTAIKAKGQAEADLEYANQDRAQREASVYDELMNGMGIAPHDIVNLTTQIRERTPKARAMLSEIEQMQSTGILDNPLEWLVNQAQLPAKQHAYNSEADIINGMQDEVNSYLSTAKDAASFATKAIPTITAAQAKAVAETKLAGAAKEAAIADETLAKTNVEFATKKLSADLAVAGQTLHTTELEIKQRTNELQAQLHAITMADSHANRLLAAGKLLEGLAKTEDEMAQRKQIGVLLENYDRVMGLPTGTTNFQTFRMLPDAQRQNMIAIGAGKAGVGPVSSMLNLRKQGMGPLASPETTKMLDHIYTLTGEIAGSPDVKVKLGGVGEAEKVVILDKEVKKRIQGEIGSAGTSMTNPFYELPPKRMLDAGQMNPESAVAKVLEPLMKQDGNVPTEVVTQAIASAFKNPNDAGQAIADYYKRNMAIRNSAMPSSLLGFQLPSEYRVGIKTGIFGRQTFDLTKSEEATRYVLLQNRIKGSGNDLQNAVRLPGTAPYNPSAPNTNDNGFLNDVTQRALGR